MPAIRASRWRQADAAHDLSVARVGMERREIPGAGEEAEAEVVLVGGLLEPAQGLLGPVERERALRQRGAGDVALAAALLEGLHKLLGVGAASGAHIGG